VGHCCGAGLQLDQWGRIKIMSKPYVSVLIDTYNHERFIERAITSVLEQDMLMDDVEILIVDDGSSDRTPEICRKFEPRARLLRKPNGGQASAFNYALPQTQGEIIAMLDGDDWWAKQKLRRALETLDEYPAVGIVGHGYYEVYSDGRPNGMAIPGDT
jgi:glycosyltransferase involved in cell wall biosynthesis